MRSILMASKKIKIREGTHRKNSMLRKAKQSVVLDDFDGNDNCGEESLYCLSIGAAFLSLQVKGLRGSCPPARPHNQKTDWRLLSFDWMKSEATFGHIVTIKRGRGPVNDEIDWMSALL